LPQWSGDDFGDVAMPRFDNPIVIMTRPKADAQRFIDVLRTISGPFSVIISPAFENETLSAEIPDFDTAIFTSRAGVAQAPRGDGRSAFCVGDATATAAKGAGYAAMSADGSADDLVTLILSQRPDVALLHMRGQISHGGIAKRLNDAGLKCHEVVAYRKAAKGPSQPICDALAVSQNIIFPLFSAETVSILKTWPLNFEGCTVVAISDVVADASATLLPLNVVVSPAPNVQAMAQTTARLIA
jgi:uroporphyrinogen-III synthase